MLNFNLSAFLGVLMLVSPNNQVFTNPLGGLLSRTFRCLQCRLP